MNLVSCKVRLAQVVCLNIWIYFAYGCQHATCSLYICTNMSVDVKSPNLFLISRFGGCYYNLSTLPYKKKFVCHWTRFSFILFHVSLTHDSSRAIFGIRSFYDSTAYYILEFCSLDQKKRTSSYVNRRLLHYDIHTIIEQRDKCKELPCSGGQKMT